MDVKSGLSALLSLIGFVALWPGGLARCASVPAVPEVRPRVAKRSTLDCDSTFESYCLNKGTCMLLVDISEHHCKCEAGFYGPRCENMELLTQPVPEEHIVAIIFFVSLLLVGLAGALYFFYKWYKKNRITVKSGLCQLH